MRLPLPFLLLAAACSTGARPSSAPAAAASGDPIWLVELRAHRAADPADQGAAYLDAYLAAESGDAERALLLLDGLESGGWPYPVPESDFPKLASQPRFRALSERLSARVWRGDAAPRAFTVGPADFLPEGIACDPRSGAVFLGSRKYRKIVRVDGTVVRDFVEPRPDLGAVLGLHVDSQRRLLWAAHNPRGKAEREAGEPRPGVISVDLDSGAVVRAAVLDGRHLLNDVAIAEGGDVYVTDSEPGALWRIRAGGAALERIAADGTFFYPNGVVWLEERQALLVADVTGLHYYEPSSGARRRVARGPAKTLGAVDGLVRHRDQLVAVQNGYRGERIVSWRFDSQRLAVTAETVLQPWHPSFVVPTTACVREGELLFISNSYAGQSDADGNPKDPARLRPTDVLAIPLP
ncbi:MAG: hypothetical protein AMXMBFR36_18580 [Acidobacteriota bacterium]